MINILIDSNIFIKSKYNVLSGALMNLNKYRNDGIVQLYTHEIINREVINHIKKDSNEAIAQFNNKIEKISIVQVAMHSKNYTINEQINSIPKNFEENFIKYMSDAIVLNNDGITLDEVIQDYFEVVPPFENNEKKKEEFPDAIIIKSIKRNFPKDKLLYIVTNDTGWSAAFENIDTSQVIVVKNIQDMLNIVSTQLMQEENNIKRFAEGQKDFLLTRAVNWLEDYDWLYHMDFIDDCVDIDVIDDIIVQKMDIIFDSIEYIDKHERFAELSFSVKAVIKIEFSYTDHAEEIYDREDQMYYNTKYGEAISIFDSKTRMEVRILIPSKEEVDENDFNILDINFSIVDDVNEISTEYRQHYEADITYEIECFAHYNTCPDCGIKLGVENDGGNGFCVKCAPNH